jgi:hypothetical protein
MRRNKHNYLFLLLFFTTEQVLTCGTAQPGNGINGASMAPTFT